MALKLFSRRSPDLKSPAKRGRGPDEIVSSPLTDPDFNPAPCEPLDNDPLKRLYQQGRHNIILKDEGRWRAHAEAEIIIQKAKLELELLAVIVDGRAKNTREFANRRIRSQDRLHVCHW